MISSILTPETKKVVLGFTPKDTTGFEESVFIPEDTLFILDDLKGLFNISNRLLHGDKPKALPPQIPASDLADTFADFFTQKITSIRQAMPPSLIDHAEPEHTDTSLSGRLTSFNPLSSQDVKKLIYKAKPKSCGLDPLPSWLLKDCLDVNPLLHMITSLINKCITTEMPDCMKQALVTPALKKSSLDCALLKSYRPISNLPFVSKVIERAVAFQLKNHLHGHQLLDTLQSAYREHHSTETALVKVQSDIVNAIDNNSAAVLVMLDLSAAFDTIDHSILLRRLQISFGVEGQALQWFRSYLIGRAQA